MVNPPSHNGATLFVQPPAGRTRLVRTRTRVDAELPGADLEKAMTEHYDTFITEQDFIEIAAAGLNWVRM